MKIKVTIEGLPAVALDALKAKMMGGALEVVLADDEPLEAPLTAREARAGNMAEAINGAEKRGLDFGSAVAQTMSAVDALLEDAIGAHHHDDHIVVFDRLLSARRELRAFWVVIAEEMKLPLSYFVDGEDDEDQD